MYSINGTLIKCNASLIVSIVDNKIGLSGISQDIDLVEFEENLRQSIINSFSEATSRRSCRFQEEKCALQCLNVEVEMIGKYIFFIMRKSAQ